MWPKDPTHPDDSRLDGVQVTLVDGLKQAAHLSRARWRVRDVVAEHEGVAVEREAQVPEPRRESL